MNRAFAFFSGLIVIAACGGETIDGVVTASVCSTYANAADCANVLLDTGGAAEKCNAGNTFEEAAAALGKLFCGN
jgi:hypothetical protein